MQIVQVASRPMRIESVYSRLAAFEPTRTRMGSAWLFAGNGARCAAEPCNTVRPAAASPDCMPFGGRGADGSDPSTSRVTRMACSPTSRMARYGNGAL